MAAILGQTVFGFELRGGGRIRGVAFRIDDSWRWMVRTAQRFDEKALGRDLVLLSREEKTLAPGIKSECSTFSFLRQES
jgi:hypothetical protein